MKTRLLIPVLALACTKIQAGVPAAEWLAGLSGNGKLVLFATDPAIKPVKVKITGLRKHEQLLGLDLRPFNGQLYGLGSTSRIYSINWETGVATAVGSGPFTPALEGKSFSFDFNPTVDRIRIMSDTGQNLRAHPDTGAVVAIDGTLAFAAGDTNEGASPEVVGAAYTNSDNDPATGTALYDIDSSLDALLLQNPPNAGVLNTVGPLGVKVANVAGFDISGASGIAYASLVEERGNGRGRGMGRIKPTGLYTIDLDTGSATLLYRLKGWNCVDSLTVIGPVAE
ncbi:DUF4394 domain-containing protein [Luteolibacter marinus]|uniref:DUF4394 domain-containing protein n=1 Tax=Luteolibacter marinus TaxID=2776705 RepID=UPI0018676255|nr:DUF4394 domain-containing protein [Luteolibacter marinus]